MVEESSINYYKQTEIIKRILEFVDNSVFLRGYNPEDISQSGRGVQYTDLFNAVETGCDLYRSVCDFKGPLMVIDLEYGNNQNIGEIFHNPFLSFKKLEPSRKSIKGVFLDEGVEHIETMTGRGYNFVFRIDRDSASYKALSRLGDKLNVLPLSSKRILKEKEETYGNIPLVEDNKVFSAFGRIADYIVDETRKNNEGFLPIEISDIFDKEEISIFDTTCFGYLINRRSVRTAFSLHQKFRSNPEYNYHGPAIVTIPMRGFSLEERLKIRQDERKNYSAAVEFARNTKANIPSGDVSSLITRYLLSERFVQDKELSEDMMSHFGEGSSWETKVDFDLYKKLMDSKVDDKTKELADWNPNPDLLSPWWIRHFILNLRRNGFSFPESVALLSSKYKEEHNWPEDLLKNDPDMRAEYWARSFWRDFKEN